MICPILEEIWIIDQVTAKMRYFFIEYRKEVIGGLIDEMRQFFTDMFWYANEIGNPARFSLFAEQVMDNVIAIVTKRLDEQWRRENMRS